MIHGKNFGALLLMAAFGIAFVGCNTDKGGKKKYAKSIPYQGSAPGPVGNNPAPTPPQNPLPGDSVDVVKQGTAHANQDIDEISRVRDPQNGSIDMFKGAHISGRDVRQASSPNVRVVKIFFDATYKDGSGRHNGNPSNGGRPLTGGVSFEPAVTVLTFQQDTWSISGSKLPMVYATYSLKPVGNELYSAEVEVPTFGVYVINFQRVSAATLQTVGKNKPADWFMFGLETNSGFDTANGSSPRGIMCYTGENNGDYSFGINHNGSDSLPSGAVTQWPVLPSGLGNPGGGGTTNQSPVINDFTVAPVTTGTVASIDSNVESVVTVNASDPDGTTPTLGLFVQGGTTAVSIVSVAPNMWKIMAPTVQKRETVTLRATADDGVATVSSDMALTVLLPNYFTGIAGVDSTTVTRTTDQPNTPATVTMRSRLDGYGVFAFNKTPVDIGGVLHIRCYVAHVARLGNTANVNPANPVAYPNGTFSELDGGYEGVSGTHIGNGLYEYLVPLGDTQGAHYSVFIANDGVAGQNSSALPASAFFQVADYDNFWAHNQGFAVTLNASGEWEFDKDNTAVDPNFQTGGSGLPIEP